MKKGSVFGWFLFIIVPVVFLAGCATGSKPLYLDYDEDGQPIMVKRYRRHAERDFEIRWSRAAYKKNKGTGPHFLLSDVQESIKEEFGPPDYIGDTYLSRKKEYVKEWIYWKAGYMFQFIKRQLVYEGPLTDKERILILHGYPDSIQIYQLGDGVERENFYYYCLFGRTQRCYHFRNGEKVEGFFVQ